MQLNRAMMNDQRQNDRDRELFSEFIEPPIPPHLIQVVPPFLVESNPVYMIQMSGEAAWKCREFYWMPRRVYDSFQASICLSARSSLNPPAIALVAQSAKI